MEMIAATQNKHKLEEIRRILTPLGYTVVGRDECCAGPEIEETGSTFAENALLKAMGVYRMTGRPCVADDSGLCVDYLDGAPGVYSARYAGSHGNDRDNNKKLLAALADVPAQQRGAAFVCAICCVFSPEDIVACEGRCPGQIAFGERGSGGFGYDPLLLVGDRTMAELSAEEKDRISHRGQALRRLAELLRQRNER